MESYQYDRLSKGTLKALLYGNPMSSDDRDFLGKLKLKSPGVDELQKI